MDSACHVINRGLQSSFLELYEFDDVAISPSLRRNIRIALPKAQLEALVENVDVLRVLIHKRTIAQDDHQEGGSVRTSTMTDIRAWNTFRVNYVLDVEEEEGEEEGEQGEEEEEEEEVEKDEEVEEEEEENNQRRSSACSQ